MSPSSPTSSTPFITGGAEKRIHEIDTRLANKGHSVTIYGRHFWDGSAQTTHDGMILRAVAPETDLYNDDRRSITEAMDFAARVIHLLNKHLRNEEHDLVVASVFPYFLVLAAKLDTVGTDTPLVTTWHEVWGEYWDDYLGHPAPFGKLTEHLTARTPQHPIAVSGITADRLAAIGPPRDRIRTIPNGINTEQIRNAPIPEQRYDVVFAGRLIEHKNVDILLEAFDAVAADHDATLGIIGDGPERERLEAKHESLTHADHAELLGFLDDYDAGARYLTAVNRKETDTRLKNGYDAEREISISEDAARAIDGYIKENRNALTDERGRDQLVTTRNGRLQKSTVRQYVYIRTRPCAA
nr:glycosyltransferase family 4 protein [Halorubrum ezzemoulense]